MRLAPSSNKWRRFCGLNLGINLALSLASFALGIVVSRVPLPSASGAERELMSGALAASPLLASATPGAAGVAAHPSPELVQPVPSLVAEAPHAAAKAKAVEAEPSWSHLAGRAQSWTAAVRADMNYGAGVVVDAKGLVLTNLHVIANARAITVTPFGSSPSPAKVLDSDSELDLALLDATLPAPLAQAAALGATNSLAVGDEVLAVGSPRKMYFSVSRGMVSFPNRLLEGVEYIQTDLPINEGNSGGPLVNREGRVVGIVSFILRESQGLSFALPIERALERFAPYLEQASKTEPKTESGAAARLGPAQPAQPAQRELPAREPPARHAH
jgi:S1-C subfamily serine protease